MFIVNNLEDWIKECEGFNSHPYLDTVGKVTIGYGRNLDAEGINEVEAELMLRNDINKCIKELSFYSWYLTQSKNVKFALVNMCFNLGINGLLEFNEMIHYLIEKNYKYAAIAALESKWAKQVGKRAEEIADLLSQG